MCLPRWTRKDEVTARALGTVHYLIPENADISSQTQRNSPGGISAPGMIPPVAGLWKGPGGPGIKKQVAKAGGRVEVGTSIPLQGHRRLAFNQPMLKPFVLFTTSLTLPMSWPDHWPSQLSYNCSSWSTQRSTSHENQDNHKVWSPYPQEMCKPHRPHSPPPPWPRADLTA